ncbi:Rho GTPase-activating protein [Sparganum proliferum]
MLGRLNVVKRLARQNSHSGNGERYLNRPAQVLKARDTKAGTIIWSAGQMAQEALIYALFRRLFLSLFTGCPQSDSPGPVFGGRLTQQAEAPDHSGVPRVLVEMVKALRRRGLCMEGIYRVPGRASRLQEIIQLANSNASELCNRLVWDEEAFDARALSSAIKRYLGALPVSLLNVNMFASFVASTAMERASERSGRSLRTPAGLASALCQLRVALVKAFGCPGKATALDLERGWRLATLDYVMRHFREVVALQAINRMSPRALALCLAPSLFGSTQDAETNSQIPASLLPAVPVPTTDPPTVVVAAATFSGRSLCWRVYIAFLGIILPPPPPSPTSHP